MGDMGEYWKDVKPAMQQASREKRASNRLNGQSSLFVRGIPFLKKNSGAHLIVFPESLDLRVDYWPGTGLWRTFYGKDEGRGIMSLMKFYDRKGVK